MPKILRASKELGTSQSDLAEIIELKGGSGRVDHTQGTETNEPLALEIRWMPEEIEELENEYVKFEAMIPVCDFGWPGQQTLASDPGRACSLAKEIAQEFQLVGQPQTFDMFENDGTRVTVNVSDHGMDDHNQQSMFFIRDDILRNYLDVHDRALIWIVWGERQYSHDLMARFGKSTEESEPRYALYRKLIQFE